MWWGVRDSVCVSAKVRGKGSERGRESSSANTGHEKCMEVVVSVCWSESCRKKKRAETGFSELSLSGLSLTQPASLCLSYPTAHFISPARLTAACTLYTLSSGFTVWLVLVVNILFLAHNLIFMELSLRA